MDKIQILQAIFDPASIFPEQESKMDAWISFTCKLIASCRAINYTDIWEKHNSIKAKRKTLGEMENEMENATFLSPACK